MATTKRGLKEGIQAGAVPGMLEALQEDEEAKRFAMLSATMGSKDLTTQLKPDSTFVRDLPPLTVASASLSMKVPGDEERIRASQDVPSQTVGKQEGLPTAASSVANASTKVSAPVGKPDKQFRTLQEELASAVEARKAARMAEASCNASGHPGPSRNSAPSAIPTLTRQQGLEAAGSSMYSKEAQGQPIGSSAEQPRISTPGPAPIPPAPPLPSKSLKVKSTKAVLQSKAGAACPPPPPAPSERALPDTRNKETAGASKNAASATNSMSLKATPSQTCNSKAAVSLPLFFNKKLEC